MTGLRRWSGAADTGAMQRLASRCWPQGLHPGGLGWSQATHQLAGELVVIDGRHGDLEGWAGVSQPGHLALQVAADRPRVRNALIEWLVGTAQGTELSVDVYDDQTRQDFVHRGFVQTSPPFGYYQMGQPGLSAAVNDVSGPAVVGYAIRDVQADEDEERVAVHRAAWRPADLPFHPNHQPALDESLSSSFTLESYRRVQSTDLYDISLDLVAVAPDGSFAGCCIGWLDRATGWAEIEPLGIVPAHRRRGLALALCAETARRVARAGGHHVFINTGPSDMYPAPYAAYRKAGFEPFIRGTTLSRDAATAQRG
jgi:GNAT superfamily N-acetyltransferase